MERSGDNTSTPTSPEPPAWSSAASSLLTTGARRMEARSYLADGYGMRRLIEAQQVGWIALSQLASVWQPSRLKGIVVPDGTGLPFLSAGQVFEAWPRVRKWLAVSRTPTLEERYVEQDWLLLSCSGNVGRLTAVYPHHENVVITHDLLRLVPHDAAVYGWLYAYMKTPQFRAVAQAAQYGHMIKHLEVEHVSSMPIIMPPKRVRDQCTKLVNSVLDNRRKSLALRSEAERRYAGLLGASKSDVTDSPATSVGSGVLRGGRRRLDATFFAPDVVNIDRLIADAKTTNVETLESVCDSVSLGSRFKRYFGSNGTPYRSAEELFDLNAPVAKRVYAGLVKNAETYMLHQGWIVMACSGQTYGLNGQAMLLGPAHDGIFGSHDLIRIIPDTESIAPGYLLTVLTHPTLGRPMVIRNAYGTSIPHLDPVDVCQVPIPRFDAKHEREIADLATESAELRDKADAHENEAANLAAEVIENFTQT